MVTIYLFHLCVLLVCFVSLQSNSANHARRALITMIRLQVTIPFPNCKYLQATACPVSLAIIQTHLDRRFAKNAKQDFHQQENLLLANLVRKDTSTPNLVDCALPALQVHFSHILVKASVMHAAFWGSRQATLHFSVMIVLQICTLSTRKPRMWHIARATVDTTV